MEANTQTPIAFIADFLKRNRNIFKGITMGILILVMLIPKSFVDGLIQERAARQETVTKEVSARWAGNQVVTGPVLVIPYKENTVVSGKITTLYKNAYFLPDKLNIRASVSPEKRHRSLFEVTLYKTDIQMNGNFVRPDFAALQIDPQNVLWNEGRLIMNISDVRGLEEEILFNWNNSRLSCKPGVPANSLMKDGVNAMPALNLQGENRFSLRMQLKGSKNLQFLPLGKLTTTRIFSSWENPSFIGSYLPGHSIVTGNGFEAYWKIPEVSRPFPQFWKDNDKQLLSQSEFGVSFLQPDNEYVQTERCSKYAILFVGLTFAVFFLMEIIQKKRIHPIQYMLVGMALIVFYTLLLSLSEYIGFNLSYGIAALATVMLIGLYVWSVFSRGRIALLFCCALAGLYGYIFFLVQLQDYALLFGSIGIFLILALLMYCTRKINWYGR